MRRKILKSNHDRHRLRLLATTIGIFLCLLAFFAPQPAHAYSFAKPVAIDATTGDVCPLEDVNGNPLVDGNNVPIPVTSGLTRRIVPCIEGLILYAANQVLGKISAFMAMTVSIACTLALLLWGLLMASGKASAPIREVFVLGLKIGAVIMFTTSFAAPYFDPKNTQGGLFGMLLDSMDYMMGVVTNYVLNTNTFATDSNCVIPANESANLLVWDTVDCALELLIGGIFSSITLFLGIIGFFVACLFSGAIGFFIGVIGFYLITQLIFAIARSSYIVVSCYIAFAIMIMISPFFIPLILFRATKSYFAKWLRLTASYMLQPMIIFAYLGMLVVAFDTVVYTGPNSLYRAIAGSNIGSGFSPFQMGAWLFCGKNTCPATVVPSCDAAHFVYCRGALGSQGVQINPRRVMEILDPTGALGTANGGELGPIGQVLQMGCPAGQTCMNTAAVGAPAAYACCNPGGGGCTAACVPSTNMLGALGIGQGIDPATGLPDARFFRIGMPVTTVDWTQLAVLNNYLIPPGDGVGPPAPDVTGYLLNLFLSITMAAITVYIFMTMLDALPFITAGISGNPYSVPFGTNNMAPPGSKLMQKLPWNPAAPPAGFGG